jgi:peroxiredoxin Q/BCP
MVDVGDNAPDFCLANEDDQEICLKDYHGKWLILYFYPKDNTSGCTKEAMDFSEKRDSLRGLDAEVVGISRDSPSSHKKFREKYRLSISLLSDQDHRVAEAYGAWALKKMYGKESLGIVRSTFLIDPEGQVAHIWRKVRVLDHAKAVMNTLGNLIIKDKAKQ